MVPLGGEEYVDRDAGRRKIIVQHFAHPPTTHTPTPTFTSFSGIVYSLQFFGNSRMYGAYDVAASKPFCARVARDRFFLQPDPVLFVRAQRLA